MSCRLATTLMSDVKFVYAICLLCLKTKYVVKSFKTTNKLA